MPITKSAIKSLRKDRRRRLINIKAKDVLKKAVKEFEKKPSDKTIQKYYSAIDTAVKKNLLHKNKAAHLKSKLSKLLMKKTTKSDFKSKKK